MLEHWLWLAHRLGIGEHVKYDLLLHFGSPEHVYSASEKAYLEIQSLQPDVRAVLLDKNLESYRKALEICERENIRILTIADKAYPDRLKNIYDPPLVLYCKGKLPDVDDLPLIGMVGTRKASAYGLSAASRLGAEITRCGGTVVSGMAAGVDAAAMDGAIHAGGGPVGVLGCGIDIVYPRSNRVLFENTERYGCILSEFQPGTEPLRWNFPRRNRIISGLSCGIVVVEAPEKSGSLITARCALDQGRDVYAVPGNIDMPGCTGSNRLLRDGAGAVSCGWDIMSEYQPRFPDKIRRDERPVPEYVQQKKEEPKAASNPGSPVRKPEPKAVSRKKDIDNGGAAPYIDLKTSMPRLSESEQVIVACLQSGERLVDDVIAETGISTGKVLGALTMLELKKVIVRHPGKRVSLR